MEKPSTTSNTATIFLQYTFRPGDRLAVVLVDKRRGDVIQRIAPVERIAAPDVQAWLHNMNAQRYEVYVSMNALRDNAVGRTKPDIGVVRHIYLDFDEGGIGAVDRFLRRNDIPRIHHLVNTSPDKWQVLWKVEGFAPKQAEALQRGLARESGADLAATDSSRVLRLPGFYNHKYAQPCLVTAEIWGDETYGPEHFPVYPDERRSPFGAARPPAAPAELSQSEKDWAYAKRALARGERPEDIVAAIADHRRCEKYDPDDYAQLTVRRAGESNCAENPDHPNQPSLNR